MLEKDNQNRREEFYRGYEQKSDLLLSRENNN